MRWFGIILTSCLILSCATSTDPSDPATSCDDPSIVDATGTTIDPTGYNGRIDIAQYGHGVGPLWGTYTIEARFVESDYGMTVGVGGLTVGDDVLLPKRMESGETLYLLTEPYDGTPQDVMVPVAIGGDPVSGFPSMQSQMYIPPQFDVEIEGYEHGTGHRDTISLSSDLVLEWDPGSMTDAKVTVTISYQPEAPDAELQKWSYTYTNSGECTIPQSVLHELAPPGTTLNLWLRRQYTRCVDVGTKHILITSSSAMYSWVRSVE